MIDFIKIKDNISLFQKYQNVIEGNLHKKSSEIIDLLLEAGPTTRTPLDELFNKICKSSNGDNLTSSAYIKSRQVKKGLIKDNNKYKGEEKFNSDKFLKYIERLEVANKNGFIELYSIDSDDYHNIDYKLNLEKILDFMFTKDILIYPEECFIDINSSIDDIIKYNKSYNYKRLKKSFSKDDIEILYLEYMITINGMMYFIPNRTWLMELIHSDNDSKDNLMLNITKYIEEYFIYENLDKYGSIFSIDGPPYKKYDGRYCSNNLKVTFIEDNKWIKSNVPLDESKKIILKEILDIENNNLKNITIANIYNKYSNKEIFTVMEDLKFNLVVLLLLGIIYIK